MKNAGELVLVGGELMSSALKLIRNMINLSTVTLMVKRSVSEQEMKQKITELKKGKRCMICLIGTAIMVNIPCGHANLCGDCNDKWRQSCQAIDRPGNNWRCEVCRNQIRQVVRIRGLILEDD